MIVIIDYDIGNVGSIHNMLKKIGANDVIISREQDTIMTADKLILPGVGSYDTGMEKLRRYGLDQMIKVHAAHGKPILGICLGMQLLGLSSEEGESEGLGLIPFKCIRFDFSNLDTDMRCVLKVPHMGWNRVNTNHVSPLTESLLDQQRYYFVHSYHAICALPDHVLMTCEYGYKFHAAVIKDNVYGVQFHPEKSHLYGMKLLENFAWRC